MWESPTSTVTASASSAPSQGPSSSSPDVVTASMEPTGLRAPPAHTGTPGQPLPHLPSHSVHNLFGGGSGGAGGPPQPHSPVGSPGIRVGPPMGGGGGHQHHDGPLGPLSHHPHLGGGGGGVGGIGGGAMTPHPHLPTSNTNHLSASGLVVPTPQRTRTIKSYHCRMCDQEYESKTDLHKHAKDVHGLEEKCHKCQHCFKSFPSSQQLTQHMLVHNNIRKYQCKFCDKTFKQLSHVQQHQRIHTGEKPYRCTMEGCEKAFAQLSNLQNHMKQHEKELNPGSGGTGRGANGGGGGDKKPYNCHVCQRRFATESSLDNHISKVHSHPPFPQSPDAMFGALLTRGRHHHHPPHHPTFASNSFHHHPGASGAHFPFPSSTGRGLDLSKSGSPTDKYPILPPTRGDNHNLQGLLEHERESKERLRRGSFGSVPEGLSGTSNSGVVGDDRKPEWMNLQILREMSARVLCEFLANTSPDQWPQGARMLGQLFADVSAQNNIPGGRILRPASPQGPTFSGPGLMPMPETRYPEITDVDSASTRGSLFDKRNQGHEFDFLQPRQVSSRFYEHDQNDRFHENHKEIERYIRNPRDFNESYPISNIEKTRMEPVDRPLSPSNTVNSSSVLKIEPSTSYGFGSSPQTQTNAAIYSNEKDTFDHRNVNRKNYDFKSPAPAPNHQTRYDGIENEADYRRSSHDSSQYYENSKITEMRNHNHKFDESTSSQQSVQQGTSSLPTPQGQMTFGQGHTRLSYDYETPESDIDDLDLESPSPPRNSLSELSKRDLKLLSTEQSRLYSFPSQVPVMKSSRYQGNIDANK